MKDLISRKDIEKMLRIFYENALVDEQIGYIFTEVAKIDLNQHLPVIVDFWEMMLFRTVNFQAKYGRSPMLRHIELNKMETLTSAHFKRWLTIFYQTVDDNFRGENAEMVKNRAWSIAQTMLQIVNRDNPTQTLIK